MESPTNTLNDSLSPEQPSQSPSLTAPEISNVSLPADTSLMPEQPINETPELSPMNSEVDTPQLNTETLQTPDDLTVDKPFKIDLPNYGPAEKNNDSFLSNIKNTLKKYKVINLAIGIVIASLISEGIYFLVDDIIMSNSLPLIQSLIGKKTDIKIGPFKIEVKKLLRNILRLCVFILVLFIIIKLAEELDIL